MTITVILIFWLGFGIYASWPWTQRLFSGDFFHGPIRSMLINIQFRRLQAHKEDLEKIRKIKNYLSVYYPNNVEKDKKPSPSPLEEQYFSTTYNDALASFAQLHIFFETCVLCENDSKRKLAPTRLGNLLRALYDYPQNRYRLEANVTWPRLFQLFPKEFTEQWENSLINYGFLLNSSLLSFVISGICLVLYLIRLPCTLTLNYANQLLIQYPSFFCPTHSTPNFFQAAYSSNNEFFYLSFFIVFLLIGYFIYRLSVTAAEQYSNITRSGYDLYRFSLLDSCCKERPEDQFDEKNEFFELTKYIMAGDELEPPDRIPTAYFHQHREEQNDSDDRKREPTRHPKKKMRNAP